MNLNQPRQTAFLSKEEFRKECHISKSTALWLIENGLIPVVRKESATTDRYLIARNDMEMYLKNRELEPKKYRYRKTERYPSGICVKSYTPARARKLRTAASITWENEPDMLLLSDVSRLLGYREKIIQEWRKTMELETVIVGQRLYFPKQYLIEFVGSANFHRIRPKSAKHLALLEATGYFR